jgi:hypothetical protein
MIKPDPHVIIGVASAVRQHPEILVWLDGVLAHELKRLPYAVENPAVFQGRCQVVVELLEFAKESPAIAAKLRDSPSNHAHR